MKTKFKVGDRVRHKNLNYQGTVVGSNGDGIVSTIWDGKPDWKKYNDPEEVLELIPATPAPFILTISGKQYERLKEISGESIWDNGRYRGCAEWRKEFEQFVEQYGFSKPWEFHITSLDRWHPSWLPWLIAHGYLKEVKKVAKKKIVKEAVHWTSQDGWIVPMGSNVTKGIPLGLLTTMTLEWEEEEA